MIFLGAIVSNLGGSVLGQEEHSRISARDCQVGLNLSEQDWATLLPCGTIKEYGIPSH